MMKHNDDDEVTVSYSSSRNISFHGEGESIGITWGDWREMSEKQRNEELDEFLYDLVDISVDDDEV